MQSHFVCRFFGTLVTLSLLGAVVLAQDKTPKKQKPQRRANPVMDPIKEDPKLPNVLLIGDSISIGYTLPTRKLLEGKANVHRIPTNGGPTTKGLQMIDAWLGKKKWDVIHFNWGLHDLWRNTTDHRVSVEDYEKNLTKLLERLKKSGAKLIWCSTTPVPEGAGHRMPGDASKYNQIAAKIMKQHNIPTNDLHAFALKQLKQIQRPKNVHFTPAGSALLAQEVARRIGEALDGK